jgi:hypothetical protein
MNTSIRFLVAIASLALGAPAFAQVTFYDQPDYEGRFFRTEAEVEDLSRTGMNNRASSIDVVGPRWEACEDTHLRGRCVLLREGRYPSLSAAGLNDRISSARPLAAGEAVRAGTHAPVPRNGVALPP